MAGACAGGGPPGLFTFVRRGRRENQENEGDT